MTTAVKEKPIIFSGELVKAILDGRKSQTRRIIKHRENRWEIMENEAGEPWPYWPCYVYAEPEPVKMPCPYGQPGDRLWVKEAWAEYREPTTVEAEQARTALRDFRDGKFTDVLEAAKAIPRATGERRAIYRADFDARTANELKPWKSSRFMPRWASRLLLEVSEVRVQRVQEISLHDAWQEGVRPAGVSEIAGDGTLDAVDPQQATSQAFRQLWNKINGPGAWERNDWVWAISFRVVS